MQSEPVYCTLQSTTTVTPAELMLGRKLKTRLDRMYPDLQRSVSDTQSMQKANHDRVETQTIFGF